MRKHPLGMTSCLLFGAASLVGIAVLRWPLAWVLLGLGGLSCWFTWRALEPQIKEFLERG